MTPERIAELRRHAEAAKYFYAGAGDTNTAHVVAACNAIPELLDELEAAQANLAEYVDVPDGWERMAEERDRLAAQVAMLDDLLTQLWRADAVPNALLEDVEVALADTEAAATAWLEAHDRELLRRLGGMPPGSLFLNERCAIVLEAMEREVGQ